LQRRLYTTLGTAPAFGSEIARSPLCQRATAEIIEQTILESSRQTLDDMIPLVRQVMRPTGTDPDLWRRHLKSKF
jgi:hypothetical protein